MLLFCCLYKKPFENSMGKGENTSYQHFLLFSQCFLTLQKHISIFELVLFCHLQILSGWTGLNYCGLEKSIMVFCRYCETGIVQKFVILLRASDLFKMFVLFLLTVMLFSLGCLSRVFKVWIVW